MGNCNILMAQIKTNRNPNQCSLKLLFKQLRKIDSRNCMLIVLAFAVSGVLNGIITYNCGLFIMFSRWIFANKKLSIVLRTSKFGDVM